MNMLCLYMIAVAHLVSVDFVGALSTQAFANTPCTANAGETKYIHAADWGLDTCYMDFMNVTKSIFLKSLFEYGVNSSVKQLSFGINDGRHLRADGRDFWAPSSDGLQRFGQQHRANP